MKLNDLITEVGVMFGVEVGDAEDSNYKILFRCANLTLTNVVSNYADCTATQEFDVDSNRMIEYESFEKTLLKIKSVKKGGIEVPYNMFTKHLSVPSGRVTVEYAYVPEFTDGEDDVGAFGGVITESVLIYGMMAEYANICCLYEEAKIYEDKFEAALFGLKCKGKPRRIAP